MLFLLPLWLQVLLCCLRDLLYELLLYHRALPLISLQIILGCRLSFYPDGLLLVLIDLNLAYRKLQNVLAADPLLAHDLQITVKCLCERLADANSRVLHPRGLRVDPQLLPLLGFAPLEQLLKFFLKEA